MDKQAFEVVVLLTKYRGRERRVEKITQDAIKILRESRAYARLQVAACNGELTPLQKVRETNLEQSIAGALKRYKATASFGGDPRGFTVKARFRGNEYNSFGGAEEGWGIA